MTLAQLLPALSGLSRGEKVAVIRTLTKELADESGDPAIEARGDYNVWSPYDADEAAMVLLDLLRAMGTDDAGG